jgi:hypothetical protein
MNFDKPANPRAASALFEGGDLIGVALLDLMSSVSGALGAQLFQGVLDNGLRAKGIEPAKTGGLFGPGFIVWTMPTQDRNPVLRAVEQVLKELKLWEQSEIAFYDKSEAYWRTIHPYGAAPFDRFLSEHNIERAQRQLAAGLEVIRAAQSVFKSSAQRKPGET